jgi:hypothetical protein
VPDKITRKQSAADTLKRAITLKGTQGHSPEPVTDEFAQAIARQLERRGIAKVPGLEPEPEMAWYEKWIELGRQHEELEAEWEARRKAEAEAEDSPKTTAGILAAEISKAATNSGSAHIPLNGAAVIKKALQDLGAQQQPIGGAGE